LQTPQAVLCKLPLNKEIPRTVEEQAQKLSIFCPPTIDFLSPNYRFFVPPKIRKPLQRKAFLMVQKCISIYKYYNSAPPPFDTGRHACHNERGTTAKRPQPGYSFIGTRTPNEPRTNPGGTVADAKGAGGGQKSIRLLEITNTEAIFCGKNSPQEIKTGSGAPCTG